MAPVQYYCQGLSNYTNYGSLELTSFNSSRQVRTDSLLLGIKNRAAKEHRVSNFAPIFNYPNNKLYQYEVKPVLVNCQFTVTPTNGLGITSLKGAGVANVFMHTSTTPSAGTGGITNPNPASGIIVVQLQNNFAKLLGMQSAIQAPTATTLTATAANVTYVITALGSATTAQWVAKGLPVGITPAVGVAFVATATGTIGGSAAVQTPTTSGVTALEIIGDPTVSLQNSNIYQNGGAQILLQAMGPSSTSSAPLLTMNSYTPAGTNDGGTPPLFTGTPATLTGTISVPTITSTLAKLAPAAGSIIRMQLLLSQSSVSVSGE